MITNNDDDNTKINQWKPRDLDHDERKICDQGKLERWRKQRQNEQSIENGFSNYLLENNWYLFCISSKTLLNKGELCIHKIKVITRSGHYWTKYHSLDGNQQLSNHECVDRINGDDIWLFFSNNYHQLTKIPEV